MKPALLKGEGSITCICQMGKFILSFPQVFQQIMTNYTGISLCCGNYCCLLTVPWCGYNPVSSKIFVSQYVGITPSATPTNHLLTSYTIMKVLFRSFLLYHWTFFNFIVRLSTWFHDLHCFRGIVITLQHPSFFVSFTQYLISRLSMSKFHIW